MVHITEEALEAVVDRNRDPEAHKAAGNAAFGEGRWVDAERHYTSALQTSVVGASDVLMDEAVRSEGSATVASGDISGDTPIESDDETGVRDSTADATKHTRETTEVNTPLDNTTPMMYSAKLQNQKGQRNRARAVYFSNRAACRLRLGKISEAISDCTQSIASDDSYLKAFARRAESRESVNPPDLEGALGDFEFVIACFEKLDDECDEKKKHERLVASAKESAKRLRPLVHEKREQMKKDMMDKLTGLGDSILGNFGLSTRNFKTQQDATGAYSVQFVPNEK